MGFPAPHRRRRRPLLPTLTLGAALLVLAAGLSRSFGAEPRTSPLSPASPLGAASPASAISPASTTISPSPANQADAERRPRSPAPGPARAGFCREAAIRELHFPHDVIVDQIRVHLAEQSPSSLAPVRLELAAGRFARGMWVAPPLGQRLQFSPGLQGDHFTLTLDPSFTAPSPSTCVERIDLLSAGVVVASVRP